MAIGVPHLRLTRGAIGDAAIHASFFFFFFFVSRYVPIHIDLGQIELYWLAKTDRFRLYWPIQANTGQFRSILALNQAKTQVKIII